MINETPTPMPSETGTRRRSTAVGVTAGVLGGAAAGLLFAVPTFTSAATDEASTDPAPVVVQQDDGTTDTSGDPSTDRHRPGVRIRVALQDLVDDNTITGEQADAVASHLAETIRDHRGDRPGHGRRGAAMEAVAEALGIDAETLRAELQAGKSIADIAADNGVDLDDVVDALLAEVEARLDAAVESGKMTEDEAADHLERAEERITARVNGERPAGDGAPAVDG